ncbi:MAG: CHAT domain-containing protein [Acidobacteria bacterium]|nr:CHAT domain-containing protein [Acidobacteriota bacterium]MCI0719812.1 CHAT domain-containing protein [Acidobacteriota bacterium]
MRHCFIVVMDSRPSNVSEFTPGSEARASRDLGPAQDVSELRSYLYPDELVLMYRLQEPNSECLVIGKTSVRTLTLPGRKHIEALVDRYRREIRSKDSGFTLARELYGLLLGSIQEIKKSPRITIVADGKLHLLPFEPLVCPEGDYLIVSHLVDYSPSATVFCMTRRKSATRRGKLPFLGIGDVPQRLRNGEAFFELNNVRLSPLPASKDEVIAISELVGNRSIQLLGEHATEEALKALPLSEFQILHFALHGISSERVASRSALVLAPTSETGEDGLLEASEISTLNLNSDLVVLSGCDTGRGDPLQADGVANLARSFLLSGAKTVVASLWGADDYYTRTLMKRFYSYLVQGMDKGSALRLAKLALINFYGREKALPVYWAGFVMIGESSTPVFPEP